MSLAKSYVLLKFEGCPLQNQYFEAKLRDALSEINIFEQN